MDQDEILVSAGGRPGHFPEHSNEANPAGRGPSLAKISLRPSRGSSQGLVGAIPSCGLAGCVPLAHLEDVRSVEGCCPLVAVRLDFFASVLDGLSGHHCCFVQGTSVAAPIYIVVQHQRSGCPGHLSCWPFPHGGLPPSHVSRGPVCCLLTTRLQHSVLFGRGLHPPGGPKAHAARNLQPGRLPGPLEGAASFVVATLLLQEMVCLRDGSVQGGEPYWANPTGAALPGGDDPCTLDERLLHHLADVRGCGRPVSPKCHVSVSDRTHRAAADAGSCSYPTPVHSREADVGGGACKLRCGQIRMSAGLRQPIRQHSD
mmetsp:Transcript_3884/g.8113  ORF Transcript_3884/g.8113 Transcript_3884/m.8113 type:complete len:315 (+) Transcript_3884:236-1180(+)